MKAVAEDIRPGIETGVITDAKEVVDRRQDVHVAARRIHFDLFL